MTLRFAHRALPAALLTLAFLSGAVRAPAVHGGSGPGPLGAAGSDSAYYYYYCPPGLVQTGSADSANGRYCAFWLLKSFPLGGDTVRSLSTAAAVPGSTFCRRGRRRAVRG